LHLTRKPVPRPPRPVRHQPLPSVAAAGTLVFALLATSRPVFAQPTPPAGDSAARLPGLTIIGTPDERDRIPGGAQVIDRATLSRARVFTTNEALRKVSGVVVRDEEGLGLRPNIGIRGLNPTRSTKTLLLEDGIPVTIAPYGDNAAYYHPPVGRMERIEVLKGAGSILHGPQTVGGVINYITPGLPASSGGTARVIGGNNGFLNGYARAEAANGNSGAVFDIGRFRADGAREHIGSEVTDASLKLFVPITPSQQLVAKANVYREASQVTYSGLTEGEWAANPLQNPFRNDFFTIERLGGTLAHALTRGSQRLTTTLYGHDITRPWWRQSSNSTQRPNDASDPTCGGLQNLESGCGNEGRIRRYQVLGAESRYARPLLLPRIAGTLELGARVHREEQERQQLNGAAHGSRTAGPAANRNAGLVEDNRRTTDALAGWVQARVGTDRFTVSPGLRLERINITRTNRLPATNAPEGTFGETALTELIPGLGATVNATHALTLFAGAHRGFSPPRNEDIISNATGGVVELAPERSWNYEAGVRWAPRTMWSVDVTAFRLDFENQVIPASLAGGTGTALTSAGRTLHQGLELDLRGDLRAIGRITPFLQLAGTWVPVARFEGDRFAYIGTGGSDVVGKVYAGQNSGNTRTRLDVSGNRLPYASEFFTTATVGVRHRHGADLSIEAVHMGEQFGDAANTRVLVSDGQQGVLPANTLWNVAVNVPVRSLGVTAFGTVKNVFDELVIVDRTRGLLPNMPRLVQLGVERRF
jgi:Fe(3+) dicitrate transport protein